jgi:murein DD-endopeptidase MepM/ murein hydrolase activator NlpD
MHGRMVLLLAMAGSLSPHAAAACETLDGTLVESPLETRRPVRGETAVLTSGFGIRFNPLLNERRLHAGVDWAAPLGTRVVAAGAGRVVSTTVSVELGNSVLIDHGTGWQTVYAHLASFDVRDGDCVTFGTDIGKVGSTGRTSGPVLHFEVRRNGQPIDPMFLPSRNPAGDVEGKQPTRRER